MHHAPSPAVAGSERDAPTIDPADIATRVVVHTKPPCAVDGLGGKVDGVGPEDVVDASAASVVQDVHTAVWSNQVDLEVARIGVEDVHFDRRGLGGIARATRYRDRTGDRGVVHDGDISRIAICLYFAAANIDRLGLDSRQAGAVGHRQSDGVCAGNGIRMARVDYSGIRTITEVPDT